MSKKLDLRNIDLFCADCINTDRAIEAIEICKNYADFNSVTFATSLPTNYKHAVKIDPITSIEGYSDFIFRRLDEFITGTHILICQWDGFIKNPDAWTPKFLEVSYLGAIVPMISLPGNGGFSLREKNFCKVVGDIYRKNCKGSNPLVEDIILIVHFRSALERLGFKFPSDELANQFSVEPLENWNGQFGFHGFQDLKKMQSDIEHSKWYRRLI